MDHGCRRFPIWPYGRLRELDGVSADLTEDERASIDALKAEHDKLEADYTEADELPDEIDQRLGEIEAALHNFVLASRSAQGTAMRSPKSFASRDRVVAGS